MNFKHFEDGDLGSPESQKDLDVLIEGVAFVKRMLERVDFMIESASLA